MGGHTVREQQDDEHAKAPPPFAHLFEEESHGRMQAPTMPVSPELFPAAPAHGPAQFDGLANMMFPDFVNSAAPTMAERREKANFDQMAVGNYFPEQNLPDDLKLPKELVQDMDAVYQESLKHETYERGGNVVRRYRGDYDVRVGGTNADDEEKQKAAAAKKAGKPYTPPKDKGTWEEDRGDVGVGQDYVGTVHTHAYEEDPKKTSSFSGEDLELFSEHERMSFLRSGDETFVVTKTREYDEMKKKASQETEDYTEDQMASAFDAGMKTAYYDVYNATKGTSRQRSDAAMKAVVKQYHLGYYSGKGDKLQRVK